MSQKIYDITAFPNEKFDGATLILEAAAAGVTLTTVSSDGDDVICDYTGTESVLDSVVAVHTGEGFFKVPVLENVEADSSDDSGSTIDKVTLTTSMLAEGTYFLSFSMEHSTTSVTGTSGSRALFEVTKNGGSATERNQDNNSENVWKLFAAGYAFEVDAGDYYTFKLQHKRIGTSGNPSKVQRARITLAKLGPIVS